MNHVEATEVSSKKRKARWQKVMSNSKKFQEIQKSPNKTGEIITN